MYVCVSPYVSIKNTVTLFEHVSEHVSACIHICMSVWLNSIYKYRWFSHKLYPNADFSNRLSFQLLGLRLLFPIPQWKAKNLLKSQNMFPLQLNSLFTIHKSLNWDLTKRENMTQLLKPLKMQYKRESSQTSPHLFRCYPFFLVFCFVLFSYHKPLF